MKSKHFKSIPKNKIQLYQNSSHRPNFHEDKILLTHERQSKRFLTSKQQQSQKHDSISICPSIEKELSKYRDDSGIVKTDLLVSQLLREKGLKDEALSKATSMIELLCEENDQIKQENRILKSKIEEMKRFIQELEQQRAINDQSYNFLTQRQHQRNKNLKVKSKSELFYQFAQSKPNIPLKTHTVIINPNYSLKQPSQSNFTNLWQKQSKSVDFKQQKISILQKISIAIIGAQIDNNKLFTEDINQMVDIQSSQYENIIEEVGKLEAEIVEEIILQRGFAQDDHSLAMKERNNLADNKIYELIQKYQATIQSYKQYSAYLRSHLCECINYLSQLKLSAPNKPNLQSITPTLSLILQDITEQFKQKIQSLLLQNQQLKSIVEQLIKNIEMSKLKPHSEDQFSTYNRMVKQLP